jgi:hypothetical protein
MQVQQIANVQNFEGRFIKIGKFSGSFLKDFKLAKKSLQDRVIFAPFDVYVKLNKNKRVLISSGPDFNKKYYVTDNGFQTATVEKYKKAYIKMRDDIAQEIQKEPFLEKVKYFLGIKKYKN